jgi:hypothetical protein
MHLERQKLEALVKQQPAGAPSGHNFPTGVLALTLEVLDARIAAAQANREASISHWRRAVVMQDAYL